MEPTTCGTVPGTEWHWTRTLTAGILQQHLVSLSSRPEMRFLFLWQLQGETPWTVQESQHEKIPQNNLLLTSKVKGTGTGQGKSPPEHFQRP